MAGWSNPHKQMTAINLQELEMEVIILATSSSYDEVNKAIATLTNAGYAHWINILGRYIVSITREKSQT
jgi:hypothetical protein